MNWWPSPNIGYTVYTIQLLTGAHTGFLKMDDPQTSGFAWEKVAFITRHGFGNFGVATGMLMGYYRDMNTYIHPKSPDNNTTIFLVTIPTTTTDQYWCSSCNCPGLACPCHVLQMRVKLTLWEYWLNTVGVFNVYSIWRRLLSWRTYYLYHTYIISMYIYIYQYRLYVWKSHRKNFQTCPDEDLFVFLSFFVKRCGKVRKVRSQRLL